MRGFFQVQLVPLLHPWLLPKSVARGGQSKRDFFAPATTTSNFAPLTSALVAWWAITAQYYLCVQCYTVRPCPDLIKEVAKPEVKGKAIEKRNKELETTTNRLPQTNKRWLACLPCELCNIIQLQYSVGYSTVGGKGAIKKRGRRVGVKGKEISTLLPSFLPSSSSSSLPLSLLPPCGKKTKSELLLLFSLH